MVQQHPSMISLARVMMTANCKERWRRAGAWLGTWRVHEQGVYKAFSVLPVFFLRCGRIQSELENTFLLFFCVKYSEDDDLRKALELSKKEEQDRIKTVEKYNELSLTEDWEADVKYVISSLQS